MKINKKTHMNQENENWQNLHRKFVEYGQNAKEWMRKCVLLLPEIEKYKIWKRKGFESIYEYARQIAGMSRNQVNEALRILNKTETLPALKSIIETKGINAIKPVITIATPETDNFWAEKANQMSQHTLETYVQDFKNIRSSGLRAEESPSVNIINSEQSTPQNTKISITMDLDPEIADQLNKLKGPGDWNTLMKELLKLRKEKLEAEKPKAVESHTRPIPVEIENYVLKKTNSTCAFPCCYKPYEILHHIDRFAMYGIHDPDRIVPLCKAHERLAHLGLIENENLEPQFWKIREHVDPDNPKYEIDIVVEKYRNPQKSA